MELSRKKLFFVFINPNSATDAVRKHVFIVAGSKFLICAWIKGKSKDGYQTAITQRKPMI